MWNIGQKSKKLYHFLGQKSKSAANYISKKYEPVLKTINKGAKIVEKVANTVERINDRYISPVMAYAPIPYGEKASKAVGITAARVKGQAQQVRNISRTMLNHAGDVHNLNERIQRLRF
jgi:hypothetical protein